MPDEDLMRRLERERGFGRDDYPVRAMWNGILAGSSFNIPQRKACFGSLSATVS